MASEQWDQIEQLCQELRDLKKENTFLRQEVQLMKKLVAEEQEQKYRALIKLSDTQRLLNLETSFELMP